MTSVTIPISVRDTSSTTGGGLGSLVFNTAGLVAEYRRQGQATWTAITLAAGTLGTWSSGGFVADGSLAGDYELGLPDLVVASAARWVAVRLRGAANMLPVRIEIELDAVNYQDAVRFGLTSLPNAVANANGGLPTRGGAIPDATAGASGGLLIVGTGTGAINPTGGKAPATLAAADVSGNLPADVKLWLATAPAALTASGYLQAMLMRWLTDNAGGTPNALQSGRADSYTGAMAANVVTAAAMADGAIDTATFAAGTTIPRVTLADTATTLTNLPTVPANWLTASGLAADAAAEIAAAVELAILNEADLSAVLEAIRVKIETSDDDLTVGLISAQVRIGLAPELADIQTLVARLTALRAANLDNLDFAISNLETPISTITGGVNSLLATINAGTFDVRNVTGKILGDSAEEMVGPGVWALDDEGNSITGEDAGAIVSAVADRITIDHGPGSYVRNTQPPTTGEIVAAIDSGSADLDAIGTLATAIKNKTDLIPASPAAVGSPMTLEDGAITAAKVAAGAIDADALAADAVAEIVTGILAAVPTPRNVTAVTSPTVADCLIAAFCGAAGDESVSGTTYLVKQPDGTSTFRSFVLDSATIPTSRT